MDHRWFDKKFSIGLVLDTTLAEYEAFLQAYHPCIANVYFSLPMGERFHARRRVAEQMKQESSVDLFWQLLTLIRRYDISLEVVFNTGGITAEDVWAGKALLDEHGIDVDLVGVVEPLWSAVREAFPRAELVYSFNNRGNGVGALRRVSHRYDEYVVGRQDIRSAEVMAFIRQEKQARTVLLVNNGCSFVCGGCSVLRNCHEAYYREARRHAPAMLYAMQSILPFELHEGLLPLHLIDRIKLSTRNSDIAYVRRCLESYVKGGEAQWIRQSEGNYYLWGRLGWHGEFYHTFDLDQIIAWKRQWYASGAWEKTPPLTGAVKVDLDLTDAPDAINRDRLDDWRRWIDRLSAGFAWEKGACWLPASDAQLAEHARLLRAAGWQVWLNASKTDAGRELPISPDGVVAQDEAALHWAAGQGLPVALGCALTALNPTPPNDYAQGNTGGYGSGLIPDCLREMYARHHASFAVTQMPPRGMQVPLDEPICLKARVSPRAAGEGVRKTLVENRVSPVLIPPLAEK